MGKLAVVKTTENASSVVDFIGAIADEQKRKDCLQLLQVMKKASGLQPKMWGTAIIGFGKHIVKSPNTAREIEWFHVGFSPRKANLTVYLMNLQIHAASLKKLGKHKVGGGCLYINKLADVDINVLEKMIATAVKAKG